MTHLHGEVLVPQADKHTSVEQIIHQALAPYVDPDLQQPNQQYRFKGFEIPGRFTGKKFLSHAHNDKLTRAVQTLEHQEPERYGLMPLADAHRIDPYDPYVSLHGHSSPQELIQQLAAAGAGPPIPDIAELSWLDTSFVCCDMFVFIDYLHVPALVGTELFGQPRLKQYLTLNEAEDPAPVWDGSLSHAFELLEVDFPIKIEEFVLATVDFSL